MRSHAVPFCIAMSAGLFGAAVAHAQGDAHTLTRSGGQMTPDQKTALEEQVAKTPDDVASRTKLLGYYFITGRQHADAKPARQRHVVWLIENAPESEVLGLPYGSLDQILEPDGYAQARQAWLNVIGKSPDNLAVLRNASRFFLLHDRKLSEDLLIKGQTLDPKNPHWPASLGHLYALGLTSLPEGPQRKTASEKSYRQYEKAYELSDAMKQDALLSNLAKTALDAGLLEEARALAGKMLDDDAAGWNRGNRIHHGNLILGQIALLEGNVAEAKSRLLLAGKTSGSPQLNSFGPNMLLAKELLDRGEKETVLEYFDLCRTFWKSDRGRLNQWAEEVKAGQIPQFGGNLAY